MPHKCPWQCWLKGQYPSWIQTGTCVSPTGTEILELMVLICSKSHNIRQGGESPHVRILITHWLHHCAHCLYVIREPWYASREWCQNTINFSHHISKSLLKSPSGDGEHFFLALHELKYTIWLAHFWQKRFPCLTLRVAGQASME